MLSAACFLHAAGLCSRGPLLVSPFRSRRIEAVLRSPMTTVRFRAAIMRSLFPTGLFNASLDFPQARLAAGSPLEPAAPASASQRRSPDLTSVPDPGLASGLRCTLGVSPPCGSQRFHQFATEKLAFPNSPISVAPRPVGTPPADLRSEFATASQAQRSSNLLEPIQFSPDRLETLKGC